MKPYSAIIFDLGAVILNISIDQCVRSFRTKIPHLDAHDFCGQVNQNPIFSRYETGQIDSQTFYEEFCSYYQAKLSFESFAESWNDMLLDLPNVRIELLDSLKKRGTRLFLLSNINELHAKKMEEVYHGIGRSGPFRQHFERGYYSFEMGLRKPDPKIFLRVLEENKLLANETLFIDDGAHHVESAKTLGLQTIHLFNTETIDKLSL